MAGFVTNEEVGVIFHLLERACASVEDQGNWDKKPYSLWYYEAKALTLKVRKVKDENLPNS